MFFSSTILLCQLGEQSSLLLLNNNLNEVSPLHGDIWNPGCSLDIQGWPILRLNFACFLRELCCSVTILQLLYSILLPLHFKTKTLGTKCIILSNLIGSFISVFFKFLSSRSFVKSRWLWVHLQFLYTTLHHYQDIQVNERLRTERNLFSD